MTHGLYISRDRLPGPPRLDEGPDSPFEPVDVALGWWRYRGLSLWFDLHSQTWRAKRNGSDVAEISREATFNEIAAALDAAIAAIS